MTSSLCSLLLKFWSQESPRVTQANSGQGTRTRLLFQSFQKLPEGSTRKPDLTGGGCSPYWPLNRKDRAHLSWQQCLTAGSWKKSTVSSWGERRKKHHSAFSNIWWHHAEAENCISRSPPLTPSKNQHEKCNQHKWNPLTDGSLLQPFLVWAFLSSTKNLNQP